MFFIEFSSWFGEMAEHWQIASIEALLDLTDYVNTFKMPSIDFSFFKNFKYKYYQNGSENGSDNAVSFVAGAGAYLSSDSTDEDSEIYMNNQKGEFHSFIKRMIEIRQLLRMAGHSEQLRLPAIVVIGSQSSGKSSVLESIVGHEFLPKGNNMITRRPLELTLVNDPSTTKDYAIFPGGKWIYDFSKVQEILTELNLAVSEEQCVSDDPIELVIHSAKIPDLSLVDLPGYIQINNQNQPTDLKEKISRLCAKYISERNIILAISAADVDLANSEALRNSRIVDPSGERTIGVITKLDLVSPTVAADIVSRNQYPLQQGYIGVICKKDSSFSSARAHEQKYFQKNSNIFGGAFSGIPSLQQKLLNALEHEMYETIDSVQENVIRELEDLDYTFKVRYNDEPISVYSYISSLTLMVKEQFRDLADSFNRAAIRKMVLKQLEEKLISIYESYFWTDNPEQVLQYFPKSAAHTTVDTFQLDVPFSFEENFQRAVSSLTMSNIGRTSCSLMTQKIIARIEETVSKSPFCYHEEAVSRLKEGFERTLQSKAASVVSQMENSLKPYKYGTEYTLEEWTLARDSTIDLLKRTLKDALKIEELIKKEIGSGKLTSTLKLLNSSENERARELIELSDKDPYLVQKAKESLQLSKKIFHIRTRLHMLHGKNCFVPASLGHARSQQSSFISTLFGWMAFWNYSIIGGDAATSLQPEFLKKKNIQTIAPTYEFEDDSAQRSMIILKDPCQYSCPEIYLHLLLNRLIKTTIPALHYELIENFCVHVAPNAFPEYLLPQKWQEKEAITQLNSMFKSSRTFPIQSEAAISFSLQNPEVAAQLRLQERRAILLKVREKLNYLKLTKDISSNSKLSDL